jgi:hypothetical protein
MTHTSPERRARPGAPVLAFLALIALAVAPAGASSRDVQAGRGEARAVDREVTIPSTQRCAAARRAAKRRRRRRCDAQPEWRSDS